MEPEITSKKWIVCFSCGLETDPSELNECLTCHELICGLALRNCPTVCWCDFFRDEIVKN
jgi:hypothetical protein